MNNKDKALLDLSAYLLSIGSAVCHHLKKYNEPEYNMILIHNTEENREIVLNMMSKFPNIYPDKKLELTEEGLFIKTCDWLIMEHCSEQLRKVGS